MPGMWTFVFQTVYARPWTRLPLMLAIPLGFKYYVHGFIESKFCELNRGHNQGDIWDRVSLKVKAMQKAEAAAAAAE